MQKVSLVKMHRDIEKLKKAVNTLNQKIRFRGDSIKIERIDESKLSPLQRRRLKEVDRQIESGNLKNFLTLNELKKKYHL
ncbi:MAG: hypothetical protein KGH65_00515 [Candidatus Micrarchaeota archaeon]|nr:hypothetical protein [Candidatus Micrarchaeota archaeon]